MNIQVYNTSTQEGKEKLASVESALSTLWQVEQEVLHAFFSSLESNTLFFGVFAEDGQLAGAIRLIQNETKSLQYGVIHDVIVAERYRGQGLSKVLMQAVIEYGAAAGFRYLELTCNPKRIEANGLYQKMGFVCLATAVATEPNTNYYRYFFRS